MKNIPLRRDKIRTWIRKNRVQAFLVTNETNVTYLTGFTGDSSYLLITPSDDILVSDSRYTTQIEEECDDLSREIRGSGTTTMQLLCKMLNRMKLSCIAVESHKLSKSMFDRMSSELEGVELVDSEGVVEELRATKDSDELREIRRSIDLAERSFRVIREALRGDQTEAEIAHNLEHQIRLFGGDRCAFEPIVGVGERAALPHAIKTKKRIEESPFVLIDWGAKAGLYTSDLTRVLVTGKAPAKLKNIYDVVLEAQQRAIAKIAPGVSIQEVDQAARGYIADAGFGKKFGHGLGHGFGLEIHETPLMSSNSDGVLKQGMVVTVEPGIYLPQWGGVRIEDDILVTKTGHEVLTSIPKSWEETRVQLI